MPLNFNETLKTKFIENFIKNVANTSVSYYIGFGKNTSWEDDELPPFSNSSVESFHYDTQHDLIFGKRIYAADVAQVARKIFWRTGIIYDQYDHRDKNLFYKNFYVINTSNRVYKCLFNNNGSPSTVMPEGDTRIGDFDTGDGYKWKYLYTLSAFLDSKFTTNDFIAINGDSGVINSAENGAIHVCQMTHNGSGYISANGQIDEQINGEEGYADHTIFKVPNTVTTSIVGAYIDSVFYTGGDPKLGSAIIQNYTTNSSGRYVITKTPITNIENNRFIITPQVKFTGDGKDAFAIASVDPLHGEISGVHVISRGSGYRYCTTDIIANTFFGSGATAYPIISPKDGHGANNIYELGCKTLGISVTTTLNDNFYDWVSYRQTSLLYNPKSSVTGSTFRNVTFFAYTSITVSSYSGEFIEDEIIRGGISGAYGKFVYRNGQKIYLRDVVGTFTPSEILSGTISAETAGILSINNRDIIPYSADVLYCKNFSPISRQGIATEQVKLYFSI